MEKKYDVELEVCNYKSRSLESSSVLESDNSYKFRLHTDNKEDIAAIYDDFKKTVEYLLNI